MGSEEGEAREARSRQTHLVTGQMVDTSGLAGCLVPVAVIWLCRDSVRATIDVGKQTSAAVSQENFIYGHWQSLLVFTWHETVFFFWYFSAI